MMIESLTSRDFAGLAPGALAIALPQGSIPLSVHRLRELPPIPQRAEPFSLVVQGPPEPLLPQGIHALLHPVHGRLDLFLVPIARDAAGARYEITFN